MSDHTRTAFTPAEIQAFAPAEKIGLVATVNPDGLPHVTLITSLMANGPRKMLLGEFSKGSSKAHLQSNPRLAFLLMTRDRKMWRGRALWKSLQQEGPEYEMYNNLPMFRYNAYVGINTVHYLDLVETGHPEKLPLGRLAGSMLLTRLLRSRFRKTRSEPALKPYARRKIFNNPGALKFISLVDADGFPVLFPIIQCQAADAGRLVLAPFPYRQELALIPENPVVAVFGLTMAMESVLVRGRLRHEKTGPGLSALVVDIDWVYNSMPPCHGRIYPPPDLSPVRDFN
ncbi:MAG: pyridoxamine 5'-phosphate oxidase family protein [Desulfosudaceae bacterium]